jgi:hypothetical protein
MREDMNNNRYKFFDQFFGLQMIFLILEGTTKIK